ncbi:hypothetical protein NE237_030248 [Protea cynaroides]|uniref:FAD-binding domain-containing protein n=1 Tax=Protea cynaroides TaxID=273540 RepID=A0A9Q0JVK7_9MAGN|nr:hypothetical protein NE237_030248 [Protea cynaroides]
MANGGLMGFDRSHLRAIDLHLPKVIGGFFTGAQVLDIAESQVSSLIWRKKMGFAEYGYGPVDSYLKGSSRNSNGSLIAHKKALLETLAGELDPGTIRFSSKLTSIRTIAIDDEVSSSIPISSVDDGRIIKVAYQFIEEGQRAGFIALNDNELYGFYRSTGPKLLQKDIMENLAKDYPPYLEVVQHADLATLMCAPLKFRYPWDLIFGHVFKGNITVAGDAMHPMTPDLAQGGGSAFEDVVVLGRHLAKSSLLNLDGHGRIVANGAAKAIEGFLFRRVFNVQYDCGKLPTVSSLSESDAQTKID